MMDTRFNNSEIYWPAVVRHYRVSAGLNQTELANRLAVTQTMVSRWEAGGAAPSRRVQDLLFDLFWADSATISRDVWMQRIAHNPCMVFVVDAQGVVQTASRGFARLAGCSPDEIAGRSIDALFEGDAMSLFERLSEAGFFEGRIAGAESAELYIGRDQAAGSRFFAHGLHRPVFMPGPQVLWLASGSEVTQQNYEDVRERLGGPSVLRKAI
ncbi:helix-turn-helix domain-containing protein [Maricaulis sp.]|uniref:helix-turn-helix domain-containing protein n=1 Tax=Maricaulis sp. TaxID=1486257 RepID=UPI00261655B9|nr:helix-turn-helix domain-containing protein [Maricaulis sp.]